MERADAYRDKTVQDVYDDIGAEMRVDYALYALDGENTGLDVGAICVTARNSLVDGKYLFEVILRLHEVIDISEYAPLYENDNAETLFKHIKSISIKKIETKSMSSALVFRIHPFHLID